MSSTHRLGQFTWRELITSDVGKAKSFYGELFNWSFESMAGAASAYLVIKHGERAIGGITQKTPSMHFSNAWTSYVSVADVDATLAATREHGGLVYAPAKDISGVGRFAVVADPSGAVVSILHTDAGDAPSVFPPPTSDFAWESLMTTDEEEAIPFYEAVFGWKVGPGMSGPGMQVFKCGEAYVADVQPVAAPLPSVWGTHVAVASLEDARTRAVRLGANVLDPRIVVPKIGLISPIIDPAGAQITLFQADDSV